MDLEHVRTLLPGYIDGELDLVTSLQIEEHLKTCPPCSLEYARMLELQTVLATHRAALIQPAPADLQRRLRASLRKANPISPTRKWNVPVLAWRLGAAVALLALLVLSAFAVTNGWLSPHREIIAQEVGIAHVRSLMGDHLTDVTSTDQHTVKPWFDGKLDFSPPVVDLAAQGFPLFGGRLDYIDGHPAAALVYMRNKHIINVLIWPTTDPQVGVQSSSNNGYHLFNWNQSGMAFWVVSDLETGELRTFVNLVQKNTP